jgi:hypothetical protein
MQRARLLTHADSAMWDALLVTLALVHGGLLATSASIPVIAVGLWWNANTISHNFIHRPFFRARGLNTAFSCYLTMLLGFPQSLWRARHLAHHAQIHSSGPKAEPRSPVAPSDAVAAIMLWGGLLAFAPRFALTVYLPGFLLGLGLCYVQGHYEHANGTVSHYGVVYNLLFFNDGYHAEHHARPGSHWRELPYVKSRDRIASRWPPVLRWLESFDLCALERLVLHYPLLQRYVLNRHQRAFGKLLPELGDVQSTGIVGGGLFPRTAIILSRLLPRSSLTLIDMNADNLATARRFLAGDIESITERFEPGSSCEFGLLVIPLAFVGDRARLYDRPPAQVVLVHDWIWRPRGKSVVISWWLLKRLNLVVR